MTGASVHAPASGLAAKAVFVGLMALAALLGHYPELRPWFLAAFLSATIVQVWIARHGRLSTTEVLVLALLLRIVFFPLPPVFSDDIFRYLWDGWLVISEENPYLHRPSDEALAGFQQSWLFDELNSPNFFSVYPPVSQYLFALGALAGPESPFAYYATKAIFAGMEFGALLVLARLVSANVLALYGWFPLVVLETAGQAHTESATVLFLIAFVWAMRRERARLAGAMLVLATWTKLFPVLLFPLLWHRFGWRGTGIALGLTAVLWIPFAHPESAANMWDSLRLYTEFFEFNAGIYYVLRHGGEMLVGYGVAQWAGVFLTAVLIASVIAIYRFSFQRNWSSERTAFYIIGAYLLCATTVHPWYLVPLLALIPLIRGIAWHWWWIGALSAGTYLRYTHDVYWTFVFMAWAGGLVILLWTYRELVIDRLLKRRAAWKVSILLGDLRRQQPRRVLDLGSAEGYVGAKIAEETGADLRLVDVTDENRTGIVHQVYDGKNLPYEDGEFDAVILSFVLHHTEDPASVVREALRVASGKVFILETTPDTDRQKRVVQWLDRWVNRLRSGEPAAFEEYLRLRSAEEWSELFEAEGGSIADVQSSGGWLNPTTYFKLCPESQPRVEPGIS